MAPLHFIPPYRGIRCSPERKYRSAVCIIPHVCIYWEVFARNLHYSISFLAGRGHKRRFTSHPWYEMAARELRDHKYHVCVLVA